VSSVEEHLLNGSLRPCQYGASGVTKMQ
jgi:hypothetical protein